MLPASMVFNGLERSLLDAALSALLFFSLTVLAMLAVRQPARRIVIARMAVLASLAIVPLGGLGPWPRLNVVDLLARSGLAPDQTLFARARPARVPAPGPAVDGTSSLDGPRTSARDGPFSSNTAVETAARWLMRGSMGLLVLGEAVGLAWLALGLIGARGMVRHSEAPMPAVREFLAQSVAASPEEARRLMNARVSARARRPMVVGLFRPTILLPPSIAQISADMGPLRLSAWHELAHIERWDHGFSTLASLAQTIWFFLPHAWWIRSRLRADQEFLADQSAARRHGSRARYALSLISLAAGGLALDRGPGPREGKTSKGVPSVLMQRIMMLLRCPFPIEPRPPGAWSWTLRFVIVVFSMIATSIVAHGPRPIAVAGSNAKAGPWTVPVDSAPVPVGRGFEPPPRFELEVEVHCRQTDLAALRIAGYSPRDTTPSSRPFAASDRRGARTGPRTWRHVYLRRDPWKAALVVDGEPLELAAGPQPTTEWLTVAPRASAPVEFRNLSVTW